MCAAAENKAQIISSILGFAKVLALFEDQT